MIDSSQFLKKIKNASPMLGNLLEDWYNQINTTFNHAGFDTKGFVQPPPPIAGLNVSAGSDHVHVTINDQSQVKKNVRYFVEYAVNDPTFAQPHVEDLGASRGRVLALPAKDGHGTVQKYYFRAYGQYGGSNPQTHQVYFGTKYVPTAVQLTGASTLTLLPSQGSGTGRADGTQGGSGIGYVLTRPPVQPKRSPAPKVA